jgi:predicted small secreted protein
VPILPGSIASPIEFPVLSVAAIFSQDSALWRCGVFAMVGKMNRIIILSVLLASAFSLSGCASPAAEKTMQGIGILTLPVGGGPLFDLAPKLFGPEEEISSWVLGAGSDAGVMLLSDCLRAVEQPGVAGWRAAPLL